MELPSHRSCFIRLVSNILLSLIFQCFRCTSVHLRQQEAPIDTGTSTDSHETSAKAVVCKQTPKPYHVLLTADDSVYEQWQTRVAYFHYMKHKALAGPCSDMGGFTRLLHTGVNDALSAEIPTVVTMRLDAKHEAGYRASNRPYAILQLLWSDEFAAAKASIVEDYILLMEPDQILTRYLPNLAASTKPDTAVAFDFWYMEMGNHSSTKSLVDRHLAKAMAMSKHSAPAASALLADASTATQESRKGRAQTALTFVEHPSDVDFSAAFDLVQPTGPSPAILHKGALQRIAPAWLELSMDLRHDPDAKTGIVDAGAANDWVSEMWAYTIAAAGAGVTHDLVQFEWELNGRSSAVLSSAAVKQDSNDTECEQSASSYFLHFAFPLAYSLTADPVDARHSEAAWRFDKHAFTSAYPPAPFPLPPVGADPAVIRFIHLLNEAEEGLSWPHRGPQSALLSIRVAQQKAAQTASSALDDMDAEFRAFTSA